MNQNQDSSHEDPTDEVALPEGDASPDEMRNDDPESDTIDEISRTDSHEPEDGDYQYVPDPAASEPSQETIADDGDPVVAAEEEEDEGTEDEDEYGDEDAQNEEDAVEDIEDEELVQDESDEEEQDDENELVDDEDEEYQEEDEDEDAQDEDDAEEDIEDEELEQDESDEEEQGDEDDLVDDEDEEYQEEDEDSRGEDDDDASIENRDQNKDGSQPRDLEAITLSPIEIDHSVLPVGVLSALDDGSGVLVDALAGRCSALGFGAKRPHETVQQVLENLTTDSAIWLGKDTTESAPEIRPLFLTSLSSTARKSLGSFFPSGMGIPDGLIQISPSADAAIDNAISMARRLKGDSCYRTIAIAGSDHGRTGMCRSATGIPEVQERFGPMMAGFTHVPMGDEKTLTAALDEQTACVLISPVNLQDAAIPCDAKFLLRVRELCDQQDIPLIIDETQVVFGASGHPATFQMLANINADLVIFSAGLFNGITGGLTLGNSEFAKTNADNLADYPLQTAILIDTLTQLDESELISPLPDDIHPLAIKIAEAISGFEFVRDINATGLTIGIESDIESSHVVATAARHGLRLASSGPTAVRLQPPLLLGEIDQQALIERISSTMETLEQEFSDPAL
ncbi:MAG: aminotransferase class III-fold pyridoxal phosphate-dependent enzyme [Rubripirellula sp.]|nr:aminotransferase class III-fold pyridoxal phosphate-dependent enzyme [Rubripirellula sp.]